MTVLWGAVAIFLLQMVTPMIWDLLLDGVILLLLGHLLRKNTKE